MRVEGNGSPLPLTIEPYRPKPGYVEVRLRENINEVTKIDEHTNEEYTMTEYDEYVFHLKNRHDLEQSIRDNFSDWLATGRTLEVNESASIVQDMKTALSILGVNE